MITPEILEKIGFVNRISPFTGKPEWGFREEGEWKDFTFLYYIEAIPKYNIEAQTCRIISGEFCSISRKCETEEDILKFIECANFLFNLK